ncbi:hypothetical protein [Vibrio cholerae]|uniref:hypothetical protein n=1 Tax=Vibrio cholerae TaxID=666 RepID=UPI0022710387|nr:hypothetical protein [Vibrio cholerae]MCX9579856.1 hypothetical protein [Vibrio cholerae]
MAIDAGTVYYTVDAKTQKAIDSVAEMKDSLEQIQTAMAKADVQTRQYTKALNEAGNSISKAGVVLDQFGNVNAEATAKMQKLMAMTDSLNQRHIQLSKTATGVRTGLAGMGREAGQAGIQFQQLIGQIQGGQDAMLVLSQQSADLGFVLGAPLLGAVVGIGASLAGMLIPNLFKTTDALGDVEKATERVKASITLSSEGITGYSEQMKVLAQVSDQLARVKLANIIADQANAMKVASTGINETISEFNGLNYQMDLFGNKSDDAFQAFIQLSQAAKSFEADPSGSITKLESALDAATRAGINNTEAGRGLVSQITDLIAQYKLGEITIDQLNKKLDESTIKFDDVGKAAEKAANKQKQWADNAERLTVKTEELRSKQLELEKAIAIKKATEEGATPETIKSMEASYNKMIANEKEAESEKALAKAKREKAASEREAQKAREAAIAEDQASADIMISLKADSDKNKNLLGQIDPMQGEQQRFQLQLDNLKSLNDAKLLEDQRYLDLKAQAETQHEQNMQALREQNFKAQSKNNELLMNSLDALGNAGTNAISGLISGTMNATQAIQSYANAVLNEAVGALVQMGMQYVKNQIMGDTAAAASVATATATGAAISAAYAPAATSASIATQGGAVGSATAAMSTGVPAMNAMLMGGRLYGGAVQANGMYRINENGAPEVFNAANGQQYMLPNTRGEVVSNKDASGSGSTVIQVNISSDGSVSTDGGSMMAQFGKEIGQFVEAKFKQMQSQSMRQGGALWQYKQNG